MTRHACNPGVACLNISRARAGSCVRQLSRGPCHGCNQRRRCLTALACAPKVEASQPWPPPVPWDGGAAFLTTSKFSLWWLGFGFLALPLIDETLGTHLSLTERATLQLPLELAKVVATAQVVRLGLHLTPTRTLNAFLVAVDVATPTYSPARGTGDVARRRCEEDSRFAGVASAHNIRGGPGGSVGGSFCARHRI